MVTPPPVGLILWRKTNLAHKDHLHVEGPVLGVGWPPEYSPPTPGLDKIIDALCARFGTMKYYLDSGTADWTHMGTFNRRPIAGTGRWSQHAYNNAIDIGPYYGRSQDPFYLFLTGQEEEPEVPPYKKVENVPDETWAKEVVDDGIAVGVIKTADNHIDDWSEIIQYGDLWTILDRLGWPKGSKT